jgi:hypothetical protein
MIFRRPRRNDRVEQVQEQEKNAELERAEQRADTLFAKAVELHTLVMRRDQENHWQQAVNKLFSGGHA